ncbi:putative protein-serine/threonine phosphatase [Helianthus annuus]|uniref:protein-serine/threonine phosphatase n=1 Tax=Helianthus annuus TaxID=4232 RepID=A0A251UN79_HELAN|nr:probable protein phosphatase 2C 24 [Helianthus annuus]KAF5804562.1 putative protein-serine/threonine phosphatase [Helianthus annuus]KAJ0569170.1 putative protein-serine/threonine phosphatase [Helianthus annuus]KAJ0583466.1 putative protein-serine/threonine phosphatase [Helianthus annuus]KAJ0746200.1 putative protein-serine/threonine phosphatase [Helianthus annuus]KAJ0749205.1 putative protein-serine/threonine phosphatase [Helianthus annuus]
MTEICHGAVREEVSSCGESSSRAARQKRMEIRKFKYVPTVGNGNGCKKAKLTVSPVSMSRGCDATVDNRCLTAGGFDVESDPKFGVASVCGRRREMEDAVAIHPSFIEDDKKSLAHYFGVYDGHGCSHVARRCKHRLHELVKEEYKKNDEWKDTMEQSFRRMDEEVTVWNQQASIGDCRCELHAPESYGVGSTAVVAVVTSDKIVVANCGDSRAVLCRNGKAVPLSNDHKPDSPDELSRIESAGGKVLYWDGARVCGVLAMSRAIGDGYLKPYVISQPDVTITERTAGDECLILASDGLWDVVSNDTACGLASLCLKGNGPSAEMKSPPNNEVSEYENCDRACSNASLLLTKLALARGSADNVSVVVVDLRKTDPYNQGQF